MNTNPQINELESMDLTSPTKCASSSAHPLDLCKISAYHLNHQSLSVVFYSAYAWFILKYKKFSCYLSGCLVCHLINILLILHLLSFHQGKDYFFILHILFFLENKSLPIWHCILLLIWVINAWGISNQERENADIV